MHWYEIRELRRKILYRVYILFGILGLWGRNMQGDTLRSEMYVCLFRGKLLQQLGQGNRQLRLNNLF
jgi:hypothetical protein